MNPALALIAFVLLASASLALSRRNLIHSALLLVVTWFSIAAFYLWAGAEFVAFAQVLVYAGAISMVVLFAVLLTRRSRADLSIQPSSRHRAASAVLSAAAVSAVLASAIFRTPLPTSSSSPAPSLSVRDLGLALMGPHVAAVLIVGAILTVALLGAVVIAAPEPQTTGAPLDDARAHPPSSPHLPEDAP